MSLTHEDIERLSRPFPVEAHTFNKRGYCYVKEGEVTARIEEIDPSWTFEIQSMRREGIGNQQAVIVARMTVNGVSRESTGMQMVEYANDSGGGKSEREAGEAEKSATTDALRRCARLFGVGRYILRMGDTVKDEGQLVTWLKKNYPPAKPAANPPNKPEPHFTDDDEKRQIIVNTAIQAGYLTSGQVWSDLLRLAELTEAQAKELPSGNALGAIVKEKGEALKRELATASISTEQARQSLGNGGHRRVISPFAAQLPEESDGKTIPTETEMNEQFDRAYQLDGA